MPHICHRVWHVLDRKSLSRVYAKYGPSAIWRGFSAKIRKEINIQGQTWFVYGICVHAPVCSCRLGSVDRACGTAPAHHTRESDAYPGGGAETSKLLVPQTYKVSEFTSTIASQDIEIEPYEVTPWVMPDIPMHADAASRDRMVIKEWTFDDNISHNPAFGSNGDLFALGNYKVARIDVSEDTQTIWTFPTDWYPSGRSYTSTVSPSGLYYFLLYDNYLGSLDPETGIFTRWNVVADGNHIHSSLDGVYFRPYNDIFVADNRDLQITRISSLQDRHDPGNTVWGDGASGLITGEIISPSGKIFTGSTYARDDGTFSIRFDGYKTTGNYTITINDMFQTYETTFDPAYELFKRGLNPTTTSKVFLQKLDPNTSKITNYITDPSLRYLHLYSHDLSDSLYMIGDGISKFVPNSGEITYWNGTYTRDDGTLDYLPQGGDWAISDDKIYMGGELSRHTLGIRIFDMATGGMNESTIPHKCYHPVRNIVVDSSETVFFNGCDGFYKFVPSTNTFTKFGSNLGSKFFEIDASDVMYWASYSSMGTASFVQTPIHILGTPVDLVGMISIPSGTSVPGCEEKNECYLPTDVVVSVGDEVIWSNDDTVLHTVTSGTTQDDESGENFDSGLFDPDETFSVIFDEVGVYPYFCTVHPWKTGSVTVRAEELPTSIVISGIETTSSTEIRINTDHKLSGSPTEAEFSVSGNTISDVVLSGVTILITLDMPILHNDVITISYTGSSIHAEDIFLDVFTNMMVTNNVIA